MRKHIAALKQEQDDNEINLTPMLDVVFIMLIFFIVTATFIREQGLDVNRPDTPEAQVVQEEGAILVIIDETDDIWIDRRLIDPRALRANIERMYAENPKASVIIQPSKRSTNKMLVAVMDAARQAGVPGVSIAESTG